MHTTTSALRMIRRYEATPEQVFDAWVDPALAVRWLFATATRPLAHAEMDARVGGGYILIDRDSRPGTRRFGTYLRMFRPSHLAFTMTTDDRTAAATSVSVGIEPMRRGCVLTLTHAGVPRGELRTLQTRWLGILYGLAETLDLLRPDTGPDTPARAAPTAAATAITSATAG